LAATSGRQILLEEIGLNVKSVWTGDGELEKIAATHTVKLNLIHCYRSMNYMCKVMEEKYGIPWLEFNFFGSDQIRESLRAIGERFDDTIKEKVELAIAKYEPIMQAIIDEYKPRLDGKKVMLLVAASVRATPSAHTRISAWTVSVPGTSSPTTTTTTVPPRRCPTLRWSMTTPPSTSSRSSPMR